MTNESKYTVRYSTGVNWVSDYTTLAGAKRQATKMCATGYGRVAMYKGDSEDPACVKYESDNKWVTPGL